VCLLEGVVNLLEGLLHLLSLRLEVLRLLGELLFLRPVRVDTTDFREGRFTVNIWYRTGEPPAAQRGKTAAASDPGPALGDESRDVPGVEPRLGQVDDPGPGLAVPGEPGDAPLGPTPFLLGLPVAENGLYVASAAAPFL
jgi:hypothetical protein